jgi:TetR/AcrR family transcriptional repressor of mexJK operon
MPQRNIPADVFSMTRSITGSPSETPRQAARRETILEIARESFLNDGYAATSMSSIAARLGGSKGTLYNYYPSKEELFAAVMQYHCAGARATFEELLAQTGELRERLQRFGEAYQTIVFSERFLAVHRLVTGESARFPELGVLFYEAAGKRGKSWLADVFAEEMDKGVIRRTDPDKVARQFLGLCRSDMHNRLLWNVTPPPTPQDIADQATDAVDVILAAYAA